MKKIFSLSFILFLFLSAPLNYAQIPDTDAVTIKQVMDGDTFRLSNGQKMKLAGVNAPELHDTPKLPQEAQRFHKEVWAFRALGDKAEEIAKRFMSATSNQMYIESATQTFDDQGNLLAYVHLPVTQLEPGMEVDGEVIMRESDGTFHIFLNAYLLKLGLAELSPSSLDAKYETLFKRLEAEAKQSKKGLWS